MRQRVLWFSVALSLSGMIFAAGQTQQGPAGRAPKATIDGTITRADSGQPLSGARVTLGRPTSAGQNLPLAVLAASDVRSFINLSAGVGSVTTDSNGRFSIIGVDPGQYVISAERNGFIRSEYGQRTPTGNGIAVQVTANQNLTLDMKMLPASVVSGRVIAPGGEPAAQATVQAYTYQYANGQRTLAGVKTTQTNDLGEYRLFWLEPGDYFVSVTIAQSLADSPVGTVDVSQTQGERGGRGGAGIQVLSSALGERAAPIVQVLGGSTIDPPVFYPGTIDPSGATSVTVAASADVRGVDFNLRPVRAATVSGRVVAPFPLTSNATTAGRYAVAVGAPVGNSPQFQFSVTGAPVQLSLDRIEGSRVGLAGLQFLQMSSTPVKADGTFEIKGVAPGPYNLTATARDPNGQQYTARTRVDVATADVANVLVAMRPGAEVRGRILLETAPPEQFKMTNLRVSLTTESSAPGGVVTYSATAGARDNAVRSFIGGGPGASAEVAEDGSFTIRDVGAMEYRVRVTGLPQGAYILAGRIESNDALNSPFTVDNPQSQLQLQLGFSPGRVSGKISDARGVATVGAQAVLVPDEARRGRTDSYFTATSDQNGQFSFNNVPPGRYKLFAWEDIPAGAYQYPDFIRRYEDRGQSINVSANSSATADIRLIPAN